VPVLRSVATSLPRRDHGSAEGQSAVPSGDAHVHRHSIGCAIAWAVLWLILALTAKKDILDGVLLVFIGWVIGWISATLARSHYPPPKKMLLADLTPRPQD